MSNSMSHTALCTSQDNTALSQPTTHLGEPSLQWLRLDLIHPELMVAQPHMLGISLDERRSEGALAHHQEDTTRFFFIVAAVIPIHPASTQPYSHRKVIDGKRDF
jgi:hypothetical protein